MKYSSYDARRSQSYLFRAYSGYCQWMKNIMLTRLTTHVFVRFHGQVKGFSNNYSIFFILRKLGYAKKPSVS